MTRLAKDGRRIGLYGALVMAALLLAFVTVARGGQGGRPTLSGDPVVGGTLTSSSAGDTALYKWQRCDPVATTCGDNTDRNDPSYADIPGATAQDRTYELTTADAGKVIRVQAKGTSLGEQFVPSAPVGPIASPEFRESAALDPTCPVEVVEPGGEAKVVDKLETVPIGTRIDVSKCVADLITIRNAEGEPQSVKLAGSAFKFSQRQEGIPYVVFKLVGKFKKGPTAGLGAGASSAKAGAFAAGSKFKRCKRLLGKKKCRKLVAQGDCLCSTSGALASGTVRGSSWYVQDGPGYTYAKAIVHQLQVRDKVKKKTILLDPGESYLAKRHRHRH
jgi:hypothetical protein